MMVSSVVFSASTPIPSDHASIRTVQRTMIEQLAQRPALPRSPPASTSTRRSKHVALGNPRLRSVHGVEGLVQEQADRPARVHPPRAVLVQRRRVPQQRQEVYDDEDEARQRDLRPSVGASTRERNLTRFGLRAARSAGMSSSREGEDARHAQGEHVDDDIGVEGLEHVARQQAVVDARVLVLAQLGQLLLADVHHLGDLDSRRGRPLCSLIFSVRATSRSLSRCVARSATRCAKGGEGRRVLIFRSAPGRGGRRVASDGQRTDKSRVEKKSWQDEKGAGLAAGICAVSGSISRLVACRVLDFHLGSVAWLGLDLCLCEPMTTAMFCDGGNTSPLPGEKDDFQRFRRSYSPAKGRTKEWWKGSGDSGRLRFIAYVCSLGQFEVHRRGHGRRRGSQLTPRMTSARSIARKSIQRLFRAMRRLASCSRAKSVRLGRLLRHLQASKSM